MFFILRLPQEQAHVSKIKPWYVLQKKRNKLGLFLGISRHIIQYRVILNESRQGEKSEYIPVCRFSDLSGITVPHTLPKTSPLLHLYYSDKIDKWHKHHTQYVVGSVYTRPP